MEEMRVCSAGDVVYLRMRWKELEKCHLGDKPVFQTTLKHHFLRIEPIQLVLLTC